jgi:subtilisin family serine protease
MTALLAIAACAEPTIPVEPGSDASLRKAPLRFNASAPENGTYLIRFKHNAVPSDFAAAVAARGGEVVWAHAGVGIAAVSGLDGEDAAVLGARKDIQGVDPDMVTVLDDQLYDVAQADATADVSPASPAAPQTAFFFARQWHLRAINAQVAWAAGRLGNATTRVGILDTGIGYTHSDLVGRVDLANSVSFLSATENARVQTAFPGANPVADLHYHGTHVAATVASNANATAGVTSGVTLVGIKVCAPGQPNTNPQLAWQASCPTSAVFGGILYAADLGLDVINLSIGGAFLRRAASARGGNPPSFIALINRVFQYAHSRGTAVVVAAGNAARDMDHDGNIYNAYCNAPHVICVSATGPTAQGGTNGPWTNVDALAPYSNFGRSAVNVAAPGGAASAVWAACSRFSLAVPVCQTGTFVVGLGGTSMASPHAAGVAALISEDVGDGDVEAIRERLESSADDLGLPGTDPAYGRGRINAARAVGL